MNEKNKIFENVIVGSGPSATSLLMSGNFKNNTCVIDANEKYTKKDFSINEKDLYKNHDIKSKIDQNDIGKDLSKKMSDQSIKNLNIRHSYMRGGFSNVWGAFSKEYNKQTLSKIGLPKNIDFNQIDELINLNNIKIFDQKEINLNILENKKLRKEKTLVSVSKKCSPCGSCLYGCPKDYIFNSTTSFNKITKDLKVFDDYVLIKFKKLSNHYKLSLRNKTTNKYKYILAKKIFLGCGPINTIKILLKSFPIINGISIKDSQSFHLPIIKKTFKFRFKDKDRIELTNQSYNLKIDGEEINFQIYHFGKFLRNQVKKIVKFNFNFLNFIFSTSHILLIFFPSNVSSIGRFSIKKNKIIFKKIKGYDEKFLNKFFDELKNQLSNKYFIFRKLLKIRGIFESYHFGSIEIDIGEQIIKPDTETGTLDNKIFKNIHLIDASNFKEIPSGPITRLIMANSLNIGKKVDKK